MIPENYALERVDVSALSAFAGNPRTHSDGQIDQIAASIREFGWTNPILVDADGTIIAGHGRLEAAKRLQLREVPVIRLGHLSEAQRKALVIADNQLALNAGWDEVALSNLIRDLDAEDFELDVLGFMARTWSAISPGSMSTPPRKPTRVNSRRFRWSRSPSQATCGSSGTIGCSAAMPRSSRMSSA